MKYHPPRPRRTPDRPLGGEYSATGHVSSDADRDLTGLRARDNHGGLS